MKRAWSKKNLWEATPSVFKAGIGRVLQMVPLPWLLGREFRKKYRFLQDAQWWDAEQINDYQLRELKKILTLAYEKTAYYRRSFDSVGFKPGDFKKLSDFVRLPTIDKETVRENLNRMITVPSNLWKVDYVSTGGSTGTTLWFYIGKERSAIEYAYLASSWQRIGYQLGIPLAVFRGRVVKQRHDGMHYEYDPIMRQHYYSNFHMTDENMRRYLDHVRGVGPCFLHVYPSSVTTLARFLSRSNIPAPRNIRGIIAESETVYPDQRRMVEEVFGCRFFSCYGHSEKLVLAAECERSTDYHVWPTYGYFELLDDDGKPVTTPGQRGEIVGTGFINDVIPFIRYRTGDFATYVDDRCEACGRECILLSNLEGRWPRGALVASDGSLISMTALNLHDETFEKIRQYQFFQDIPGKAILHVLPLQPLVARDLDRIRRGLEPKLAGRVELTVQIVDEIRLTKSGKFNLIEQRIAGIETHPLVRTTGS